MSAELAAVSPLAAFIGAFLDFSPPAWSLILMAIAVHWFFLLIPPVMAMSYLDRKLCADIQMRIGPNRVSPYGLAQAVADSLKWFFKEDAIPVSQETWLFKWGIVAAIVSVFVAIGSIPVAENWALSNPDSGVICVLLALGTSNLCVFWAAYSAESQWSVLSAFRVLSMISAYLVPIAICLVPPVLIAGSPNFEVIVRAQGGAPWRWFVFHDPGALLSCMALFLALLIWQGRAPFDHYRAAGEVAGGVIGEYSGLRRGLILFLEYASVYLASAVIVTTYLGGWQTPFSLESFGRAANLVQWLVFAAKVFALVFVSIWIRWSLPRQRIDQIVGLSWRVLVPIGLLGLAVTAVWMVLFGGKGAGDFL